MGFNVKANAVGGWKVVSECAAYGLQLDCPEFGWVRIFAYISAPDDFVVTVDDGAHGRDIALRIRGIAAAKAFVEIARRALRGRDEQLELFMEVPA